MNIFLSNDQGRQNRPAGWLVLFGLVLGGCGSAGGSNELPESRDTASEPFSEANQEPQVSHPSPVPTPESPSTDGTSSAAPASDSEGVSDSSKDSDEATQHCVTQKDCGEGMVCSARLVPSQCVPGERAELGPLGQAPPPVGLFDTPHGEE